MITITPSAAEKLSGVMDQKGLAETHALRVFVKGGGCGGMQYGMTFDDAPREDDQMYEQHGLQASSSIPRASSTSTARTSTTLTT